MKAARALRRKMNSVGRAQPFDRASELYQRVMTMADKRDFDATEIEMLTAFALAHAMLNDEPSGSAVIAKRIVELAYELIDTGWIREPT